MILNRNLDAAFLTDDIGARDHIDDHALPIQVVSTDELLATTVNMGLMTDPVAQSHIRALLAANRGVALWRYISSLNG